MPFPTLLRYFSDDLAIDLGTANTLVFVTFALVALGFAALTYRSLFDRR